MLTLNIEDDSVRIALIKGKRVITAVEEPLPAGMVRDGVVVNKNGVSDVINSLLKQHSISEKDVYLCVSGIHSIFRLVTVPRLNRKLLNEVARKEMERVSPVPLDTIYIAWHELRLSGEESSLYLMGLPHDNVDSVIETVRLSGLKEKSVELKPLIVARVIDERTAIAVNIQSGGYDITIIDNILPVVIRSLSFHTENMTEEDKIAAVREELARTINFYNTSHSGRQLDDNTACFISGIVSSGLAQQLDHNIKHLPDFLVYPPGTDEARFAANTGLAIGAHGGGTRWMKVAIDVLPGIRLEKQSPKANTAPVAVLALGALIIAMMFIANGTISKETTNLQALVNAKTKQVTDMQKLLKEDRDKIVKQRDELKAALVQLKSPIDQVKSSRNMVDHKLGEAIAVLPGVMYLTVIGYDEGVITLSGLAPDLDTVMGYADSIRQTGLFRAVNIASLENVSYNDTRFSLTLIPIN